MPDNIEVSIDEVLEKRKAFADDNGVLFKAHAQPASWDDQERSAVFIMSAETEDRHRDIVEQEGIKLDTFNTNPIAFFNHKSFDTPIGSWSDIKMVRGRPKRTEGKLSFVEEGVDETGDRIARHVAAGTLKASSIGFRPLKMERIEDDEGNWTYGFRFKEIELIECSVVTVPAVREALIKGTFKDTDVLHPEVIEDFLDNLKSAPAVAKMVDQKLYLEVLKEITGNKFISIGDLKPGMIMPATDSTPKWATDINTKLDKILGEETVEQDVPDELAKGMETSLKATVDEFEPQIAEIEDEERKSTLAKMIDGIKSLFKEPEPEPADPDRTKSLLERAEALEAN